jgi:hypothetical protein
VLHLLLWREDVCRLDVHHCCCTYIALGGCCDDTDPSDRESERERATHRSRQAIHSGRAAASELESRCVNNSKRAQKFKWFATAPSQRCRSCLSLLVLFVVCLACNDNEMIAAQEYPIVYEYKPYQHDEPVLLAEKILADDEAASARTGCVRTCRRLFGTSIVRRRDVRALCGCPWCLCLLGSGWLRLWDCVGVLC